MLWLGRFTVSLPPPTSAPEPDGPLSDYERDWLLEWQMGRLGGPRAVKRLAFIRHLVQTGELDGDTHAAKANARWWRRMSRRLDS